MIRGSEAKDSSFVKTEHREQNMLGLSAVRY